jgi:hypothetical protein
VDCQRCFLGKVVHLPGQDFAVLLRHRLGGVLCRLLHAIPWGQARYDRVVLLGYHGCVRHSQRSPRFRWLHGDVQILDFWSLCSGRVGELAFEAAGPSSLIRGRMMRGEFGKGMGGGGGRWEEEVGWRGGGCVMGGVG